MGALERIGKKNMRGERQIDGNFCLKIEIFTWDTLRYVDTVCQ